VDNEEEWCIMRKSGGQLERAVDNEEEWRIMRKSDGQ
jgi:hypothetical protein